MTRMRIPWTRWTGALVAPCLAVVVGSAGCKLMDEGLNNEQLKEFRKQGEEAGAGLKAPEGLKLPGGDKPAEAAPVEEATPKTGAALVEELVSKRARCGTDRDCGHALLEEIRALGKPAEQPLIGLLADNMAGEVRLEAVRIIAFLRVSAALPALGRVVNDTRPDMQRESVWALGEIRDPRAVETLARVLTSSQRLELRDAAAQALGTLRAPEAAEALIAAWKTAESRTRAPIVSALGQIGDPSATDVLIEALTLRDDVTRLEAANALEAIGALDAGKDRRARRALQRLLHAPGTSELVLGRVRTILGADTESPPDDPLAPDAGANDP